MHSCLLVPTLITVRSSRTLTSVAEDLVDHGEPWLIYTARKSAQRVFGLFQYVASPSSASVVQSLDNGSELVGNSIQSQVTDGVILS